MVGQKDWDRHLAKRFTHIRKLQSLYEDWIGEAVLSDRGRESDSFVWRGSWVGCLRVGVVPIFQNPAIYPQSNSWHPSPL